MKEDSSGADRSAAQIGGRAKEMRIKAHPFGLSARELSSLIEVNKFRVRLFRAQRLRYDKAAKRYSGLPSRKNHEFGTTPLTARDIANVHLQRIGYNETAFLRHPFLIARVPRARKRSAKEEVS